MSWTEMSNPHDRLFKFTFSQLEHARSVLESVLPASLTALIRWETLALESGEFVDPHLAQLESDLLFSARLRSSSKPGSVGTTSVDRKSARPAESGDSLIHIYVLFEHQSTVDPRMPLRLLRYMTKIWERVEHDHPRSPPPVIIPVVLHHGDSRWTASTSLANLFEAGIAQPAVAALLAPFIPKFEVVMDDLASIDDDALRARAVTELVRLTLVVLQRGRGSLDPVGLLRAWIQTVIAVIAAPRGIDALKTIARYLMEAASGPPEDFAEFLIELVPNGEEADMTEFVTIAEQLRRRGLAEGLAEGRADMLLLLLTEKFGELPDEASRTVAQASEDELKRWARLILSATSLDEVLGA
jgi:predicted transposase YdaD